MPFAETKSLTPVALRRTAQSLVRTVDPKATVSTETPLLTIRYPITRFRFTASVFAVERLARTPERGAYVAIANLESIAVPAPHRKLLGQLCSDR
jgi:hypothetical protein